MAYIGNQPAETPVKEILETDIKIGEDDQTKIDFADANTINFHANNAKEMVLVENSLSPGTSEGTALGTTSLMWSDLFLASGSVINLDNGDVTLTHSANTLTVAGGTLATAALTASTGTFSGILKTDDSTNATSTTDGSLQTDGGLSVVLDAIFGDDVSLLSDSAVINMGAGNDVTFTHDGTTGATITGTPMVYESKGASALANDTHTGLVLEFIAHENLVTGNAVYVHTDDGEVAKAQADAVTTMPAIGVVMADANANNPVKVLVQGVYNDSNGFGGDLTEGAIMYVDDDTAGLVTATIPDADGEFVQRVGIAVGPRDVYISPSLDVIERD